MKYCNICGTLNLDENNFCTHCGSDFTIEVLCPHCNSFNPCDGVFCIKCNRKINPIEINNFNAFFIEHNLSLIVGSDFSGDDYSLILDKIFKKLDYVNLGGLPLKNKILQIANSFTRVVTKSSGVSLGEYGVNIIFYDDRLDDSIQISTIIHELAHFLLFDIVVNILAYVFDIIPSPVLKSFVEYVLTLPEMEIINEYCAHTVQNRFIPHQYQSFDSFNSCVNKLDLGSEEIEDYMLLGNSFAGDIIDYLERYIDESLRESIRLQFKIDGVAKSELIYQDFNGCLEVDEKIKYLIGVFASFFNIFLNNEEVREELEYVKLKFEN